MLLLINMYSTSIFLIDSFFFNFYFVLRYTVQSLSYVQLFATPWTIAFSASSALLHLLEFAQIHVRWVFYCISSAAALFSFCLQSFPESGSFPMSQLFTSCGQSIGNAVLPTALPMNVQGWFPLGLTDLISLQSKWFSRDGYSSPINKWAPWDLETLNSFNKLRSPDFQESNSCITISDYKVCTVSNISLPSPHTGKIRSCPPEIQNSMQSHKQTWGILIWNMLSSII